MRTRELFRGRFASHAVPLAILASAIVACVWVPAAAAAPTFTSERVSGEAPSMGDADADSETPVVSADGRYVAYVSRATDILGAGVMPPDTGGYSDVFRYDRLTGQTILISRNYDEGWGTGDSAHPSISADGRYVAFDSAANDLAVGDAGGNDVFVRDTLMGVTTRASEDYMGGDPNNTSYNPSISADGNRVAFASHATDLVNDDANGKMDVFVRDIALQQTWRCEGRGGVEPDGASNMPAISGDGSSVAFLSGATNLVPGDDEGFTDVFYWVVGGSFSTYPERVSESQYDGEGGDGDSRDPSVSADGSIVAYYSAATNLDTDDTNGIADIYAWEQGFNSNARVSVSASGGDPNGASYDPSISADGARVAFRSQATNLVASGDSGSAFSIYVRDLYAHETYLTSLNTGGTAVTVSCYDPCLSADGLHIAYSSTAANIAPDGNGLEDAFVATQRVMTSVYRFYNKTNGSHFYTPNAAERDSVIAKYSAIYTYEGVAYQVNDSLSWQPLYRFYNKINGTHFYTASATERDYVKSKLSATYQYDGPTYSVATRAGTGRTVWRFYNKKLGSHFYTANEAEKNSVVANLSAIFTLEGAAFYLPQ